MVYGSDGEPIKVGEPIFTQDEWDTMQAALDKRSWKQPARQVGGATKFLGVLKCADCGTNMTVKQSTHRPTANNRLKTTKTYAYLRCQNCPTGGLGAPDPGAIYEAVQAKVLSVLGDMPVERRECARGEEMRKRVADLEQRIAFYMEGLEPGGRFTRTEFTRTQSESALDKLIAELESIDKSTTEDRWIKVAGGKTWREHWEAGGLDAMAADRVRVGITVEVTRTKVPRQRAPKVGLRLTVPPDYAERLVLKHDAFGLDF